MAGALAITDARLWDGTGSDPVDGATILVEDGRIRAVGPDVPVPDGVERLDAGGRFTMPGLVDMHVHVLLSGDEGSLPAFLGAGVTSIRDVGGDAGRLIAMREAVASGALTGPRIFAYGPLLDGDPPIFYGDASMSPIVHPPIATLDEARATVEGLLEQGVDGIKVYAGVRPDMAAAMIEAAAGQVPVTGHLGRTWASEAAEAGIDCLEHVHATCYQDVARPEDRHEREGGNGAMPNYWTWLNGGWARADLDADYVRRFIALLVEREVALSPTTVLATNGIATTDAAAEPGRRYTPRSMGERLVARSERFRQMREEAERAGRPMPERDPDEGRRALEQELAFLLRFHEAGGRLVPSTDCGAHTGLVPGFSLLFELELLAGAGMATYDVLRGATSVAAKVLRRDEDLGTIEPGKVADLIVVDGDPLANIADVRRTVHVVKDGVAHDPAALLASVETLEAS